MFILSLVSLVWGMQSGVANNTSSPPHATDFCWPNQYSRNTPEVATACLEGKENNSGLCYTNCRSNYNGIGPVCWRRSKAPRTLKLSYGRGFGSFPRCGTGKERIGALCYPTCASGYQGKGYSCYSHCSGLTPYICGAGCARNQDACTITVWGQISAPVQLSTNIGLLVSMAAGVPYSVSLMMAPVETAGILNIIIVLVSVRTILGMGFHNHTDLPQSILMGIVDNVVNHAANGTPVDWTRMDPVGTAQLVRTFYKPNCLVKIGDTNSTELSSILELSVERNGSSFSIPIAQSMNQEPVKGMALQNDELPKISNLSRIPAQELDLSGDHSASVTFSELMHEERTEPISETVDASPDATEQFRNSSLLFNSKNLHKILREKIKMPETPFQNPGDNHKSQSRVMDIFLNRLDPYHQESSRMEHSTELSSLQEYPSSDPVQFQESFTQLPSITSQFQVSSVTQSSSEFKVTDAVIN